MRFRKQLQIGRHWLNGGWRLLRRNPWKLGGMAATAAGLASVLALTPLVGSLLMALVAPLFLASHYLVIDALSREPKPARVRQRWNVIKQSPRALLAVFEHEPHLVHTLLAVLYSVAVGLLVLMFADLLGGSAWSQPWSKLDGYSRASVLATGLIAAAGWLLLALSLVYALPLAYFQEEGLVRAIARSFRTGLHHAVALWPVLALALAPLVAGVVGYSLSRWAARPAAVLVAAFTLPLAATTLYCSYRTLFPAHATAAHVAASSSSQRA